MDKSMNRDSKPHKSVGEKIFDVGVYGGLAGVSTFILTIPVADWLKFRGGAKYYKQMSGWMENTVLKFLPEGARKKTTENFLMTGILMQGGNLLLVPITMLEHMKVGIVNGLNQMFGDKTDPSSIEEAPKQSISSLIKGRLLAFGVVWAAFATVGKFFGPQMGAFEEKTGKFFTDLMKKPTHIFNPKTAKIEESITYSYGKMASLDAFATTAAASILYVGSRFFAKQRDHAANTHPAPAAAMPLAMEAPATPAADKPGHTITQASRAADTLAAAPERSSSLA